jgi:hypothetical protein
MDLWGVSQLIGADYPGASSTRIQFSRSTVSRLILGHELTIE